MGLLRLLLMGLGVPLAQWLYQRWKQRSTTPAEPPAPPLPPGGDSGHALSRYPLGAVTLTYRRPGGAGPAVFTLTGAVLEVVPPVAANPRPELIYRLYADALAGAADAVREFAEERRPPFQQPTPMVPFGILWLARGGQKLWLEGAALIAGLPGANTDGGTVLADVILEGSTNSPAFLLDRLREWGVGAT